MSLFRRARQELDIPLVGIGGIQAGNAARVVEAGAQAVAVVEALFAAGDVESAARRLSAVVAAARGG